MIKELITANLGNHYQKKARIAIQKGKWKEALANTEKALKLLPLDTGILNNKGLALGGLGRCDEAISCFDMVIARYDSFRNDTIYLEGDNEDYLKETYISAINNKGYMLSRLGKNTEARKLHELVLKLDPDRKSAVRNLREDIKSAESNTYENLFKSVEKVNGEETARKVILDEIESYNQSLLKDPNNISLLINKGTALAELNKYEDALVCYDKALKIDSSNIMGLMNKGSILGRMGRYKESIEWFDRILKFEPKNKLALEHKKLATNLENKRK